MILKLIKDLHSKITNEQLIGACILTLLASIVIGFIAPYCPSFARETLAYATGWLVEITFITCIYLIIRSWGAIGILSKYFIVVGTFLLTIMYGLWLCCDFGSNYPFISAIGFNIGTIFRTASICLLAGIINKRVKS